MKACLLGLGLLLGGHRLLVADFALGHVGGAQAEALPVAELELIDEELLREGSPRASRTTFGGQLECPLN